MFLGSIGFIVFIGFRLLEAPLYSPTYYSPAYGIPIEGTLHFERPQVLSLK